MTNNYFRPLIGVRQHPTMLVGSLEIDSKAVRGQEKRWILPEQLCLGKDSVKEKFDLKEQKVRNVALRAPLIRQTAFTCLIVPVVVLEIGLNAE